MKKSLVVRKKLKNYLNRMLFLTHAFKLAARYFIKNAQSSEYFEKEANHLLGMIPFLREEEKALVFQVYEEGAVKLPTLSQPVHCLIQNGFLFKKYSVSEDFLVCQMTKVGQQAVHDFIGK